MVSMLLISAVIVLACIVANRFSQKVGLPALLLFMVLGMVFGTDGMVKIEFQDYFLTEQICTVALIFIMFYGGFCTNWKAAKAVAARALILSTAGVAATAFLTWLFCYYILKFPILDSFLIGAVISSTDAASVFSILRSKKLSLKHGTASLLEIESGSNDPFAYMLTMIALSLLKEPGSVSIGYLLFSQVVYGVVIGVAAALIAVFVLRHFQKDMDELSTIFVIAMVLISYALPSYIGGNGYLSVYLMGIILGNSKIKDKITLVHFFDGITGLAQIVIFFLLGLLATPHLLPAIFAPALLIALFLTVVARPLAVFLLMTPAKCGIRQCLLISWAGLRGAASIVFAILAMASGVKLESDIFHIVFLIALLSVAIQGTLLPLAAKNLKMVDETADVRRTFNDYQDESEITLMRMFIPTGHNWENKSIGEVSMPTGSLAMMIKREEDTIIPKGDTMIQANDSIILSVPSYSDQEEIHLKEIQIDPDHDWCDKRIEDLKLPEDILIALVKRKEGNVIPSGTTKLLAGDVVVIYH